MLGNVWELCWAYGDVFDRQQHDKLTALGGDFHYPSAPGSAGALASPYGDRPCDGNGNIGFRVVRREGGCGRPAMTMDEDMRVPTWEIPKGQQPEAQRQPRADDIPVLAMAQLDEGAYARVADGKTVRINAFQMASSEVTYSQWRTVVHWAEASGYEFDLTGAMGSMYWYEFAHAPDEPVTDITWHDALVWCDALSEMEGRTPVY
jgi:formylglycine-generating enzyme required for sulfatase activity